jgi:hypothetical protein
MTNAKTMLENHPAKISADINSLADCIDECFHCSMTCNICADECLGEQNVMELQRCIRLNLTCADICLTTGKALSRISDRDWPLYRLQLESCITACRMCAEECGRHSRHHEHCRLCAESCRRCEEACVGLMRSMPVAA